MLSTLGDIQRTARTPLELDETNDVSCKGEPGVSNAFASALWAADYIARAMRSGLRGVDFHDLPELPLSYSPLVGEGSALHANPEWYALLLTHALQGTSVLPTAVGSGADLTAQGFLGSDGSVELLLVNFAPVGTKPLPVALQLHGRAAAQGTILRLTGPSEGATSGVELGGEEVSASGSWKPKLPLPTVSEHNGSMSLSMPAASAALVTIRAPVARGRSRAGRKPDRGSGRWSRMWRAARRGLGRLTLTQQVALLSAIPMLILGFVLAGVLQSQLLGRTLAEETRAARLIAHIGIQPRLTPDEVRNGLSAAQIRDLDGQLRTCAVKRELARIKIWNAADTVVYSDDHGLIGRTLQPSDDLEEALAGEPQEAAIVNPSPHSETAGEVGLGTLIEVYVPLRFSSRGRPAGAFEMYLSYRPVAGAIARDRKEVALLIAAGLLVLWLVLFRIVAGASRRLRVQAQENDRLARYDRLTGLANRTLYSERLDGVLARERAAGRRGGPDRRHRRLQADQPHVRKRGRRRAPAGCRRAPGGRPRRRPPRRPGRERRVRDAVGPAARRRRGSRGGCRPASARGTRGV